MCQWINEGDEQYLLDVTVFHAGTKSVDGKVVTAGGRVLAVTGVSSTLEKAIQKANESVKLVSFDGAEFRTDIGHRFVGVCHVVD